jgi:hypothetical protein
MKKMFKSGFLLAGLMLFAIAITFSSTVFGQEKVTIDGESYDLQSSVDILAENQLKLIELIKTVINKEPVDIAQAATRTATLSGGDYDPFENCFGGYTSWPSSSSYDDQAGLFPLPFVMSLHQGFTDINGDGIMDFVYANRSGGSTATHYSCVLLGNGNGMDVAYRCNAVYTSTGGSGYWTFYGDCADLS